MAQALHAGIEFTLKFPSLIQRWHHDSNNVVILGVPDEAALMVLDSLAFSLGLKHHLVIEPDIGDQATAIALEPSLFAKRMCAGYPLALKEFAMA
jgi:peptidyl-tRNA hydrolase